MTRNKPTPKTSTTPSPFASPPSSSSLPLHSAQTKVHRTKKPRMATAIVLGFLLLFLMKACVNSYKAPENAQVTPTHGVPAAETSTTESGASQDPAEVDAQTLGVADSSSGTQTQGSASLDQAQTAAQDPASSTQTQAFSAKSASLDPLPEPNGELFVIINNNQPDFENEHLSPVIFESFSQLDYLGRVGVANACIGRESMPNERRGSISQVKPAGWMQRQYSFIKTRDLYNRSHLIAHQLSGENANPLNLTTGTYQLNQVGMVIFERKVVDYLKASNNHVRYRVTPHFLGEELVPRGIQMEAKSIEDAGEGLSYNVYIFNIQPGVDINYLTGDSKANGESTQTLPPPRAWIKAQKKVKKSGGSESSSSGVSESSGSHSSSKRASGKSSDKSSSERTGSTESSSSKGLIKGNIRSKIYHMPGQQSYNKLKEENTRYFNSEQEAQDAGYRKAKR